MGEDEKKVPVKSTPKPKKAAKKAKKADISKTELLKKLKDFAKKHKRPPHQKDCGRLVPGYGIYVKKFGSLTAALVRAGIVKKAVKK